MALTPLHVTNFCQSGKQCKYLWWESLDGKFVACCLKHAPQYYRDVQKNWQMYGMDSDEKGDNCDGYLFLKYKQQGFDV